MHIRVWRDQDAESPRDWDNLGTMVCFHRRYTLGDKDHGYRSSTYNGWDDIESAILKDNPGAVILPVYMYDHSGITISTTPFSCPWDSGQIGFIFIARSKILKEYGGKIVTKKLRERVTKYLEGEVETYDKYLRGEVYGFTLYDDNDDPVDSCGGFFGDRDDDSLESRMRDYLDEEHWPLLHDALQQG